jgi:hypothetical protein
MLAAATAAAALAGCGGSHRSSSSTSASSSPAATTTSAPTTGSATSAPPGSPGTGACTGSQLALSYAGTEGGTGHLELTLALRNVGSRTCAVRGYPGVRLLDRIGRALPLRVQRGHGFFPDTLSAPRAVALTPGTSARFGISFVTNNEYAGARVCRTASAAMSAVPGWSGSRWERVSLRAAPRIAPCGNQVVVSPVHA